MFRAVIQFVVAIVVPANWLRLLYPEASSRSWVIVYGLMTFDERLVLQYKPPRATALNFLYLLKGSILSRTGVSWLRFGQEDWCRVGQRT
jgi:hypothetical protein